MQKISSYLYPNRVQLLANLAGFTVEYTNVYQRNVKIYNGIDNTIEFDIKNADQKRIDLTTLSQLVMNVMDAAGNELPNSPYTINNISDMRGLATVVIPADDLADLVPQFLKYSVTAIKAGADVLLYADDKFGAVGTIELVGSAMPTIRDDKVYTDFAGEINFMGNVIHHSPAIPAKFYEAVKTEVLDLEIELKDFVGTLYIEATKDMTISVNSYLDAPRVFEANYNTATTITQPFSALVGDYNYFRVSWVYPNMWAQSGQGQLPFGTVTKVTVIS